MSGPRFHSRRTALAAALLRRIIPPAADVAEIGCADGELLRALEPRYGLGIDVDAAVIERAKAGVDGPISKHRAQRARLHQTEQPGSVVAGVADPGDWKSMPNRAHSPSLRLGGQDEPGTYNGANCEFHVGDVQALTEWNGRRFDYLVADHLVGELRDVQAAFSNLLPLAHERTRLCLLARNNVWLPLTLLAQGLGLRRRERPENWLATKDLVNLLELSGWEVVQAQTEWLWPGRLPLVSGFFNRFLVRLPGLRHFGSMVCIVARPLRVERPSNRTCSVIVPVRNEAGNVRPALSRLPMLGSRTEVIFVEGQSTDDTWEVLQREIAVYRGPLQLRALRQPGRGKWDAVRAGFAVATGDVLVVQDGDLTAPPEDLPKFFAAVDSGAAEFANGSRLVYPMEKQAMRFLNLVANKCFALALSYTLGQPIKDSLCGTKMLLRSDYERLLERIAPLGDFDPFGDFNLLFGAARLNLKIRDIPVRYRERAYGTTNIARFRHGWLLLKMTVFGLLKLKFGRH